jgi:uncharacterized protein (TIGR03545 family)
MIRWKAFIPITVIVALIVIFTIVFLDGILKSMIVKTGQAIFRAKVEVQSVTFKFKDFSLDIKGLAVADKDDPWTNLFEVGKARGMLTPSQLLYKKVIIDEMSVEGLTWGGKRTTSGKLPRVAKEEKKEKKPGIVEKYTKQISLPDMKTLEEKLDVKKLVSPDQLAAVKKSEELKSTFATQSETWKKNADELKVQTKEAEQIADRLKTLPDLKVKTLDDVQKVTAAIDDLRKAKKTLETLQKDVRSKKAAFQKDIGSYQGQVKDLDALRETDYRNILDKLNLGSLDVKNISEAVFGPVLVSKAVKIQRYVGLLKKYMPARKKNEVRTEVKPARMKGIDVRFPLSRVYPEFLVEKISVSGNHDKVAFGGLVTGITSNPPMYGKPAKLDIKGSRGSEKVSLSGVVDHTGETIDDTFAFILRGIDLSGKRISSGNYLQHEIAKGREAVETRIAFQGDDWKVKFLVEATGLKLSRKEPTSDKTMQLVDEVLENIDIITVEALVAEKGGETSFSCKSNLDKLLLNKIKGLFGEKLDEAKAKIRKELDAVVDAKKKELLGMIDEKKKTLLADYDSKEGIIQNVLSQVTGKITEGQGGISNAKDQEVEKQKQNLKKKGAEELMKLF